MTQNEISGRPLWLSALCIFSWILYGCLAALFILALFYTGWITELIVQYVPDKSWVSGEVVLLFLGGFMLHVIAFTGVIFMWKLRRIGYYLFTIPSLLIAAFHLFRPDISWISTALYVLLVVLFGIFLRRMN